MKEGVKKCLRLNSIKPGLLQAEYAVRGFIPQTAEKLKAELKLTPTLYPFSETVELNIGNPQAFGQKPFSFNREVLTCILAGKESLNNMPFEFDIKARAQQYMDRIGSIGAYSHSLGHNFIRQSVGEYLNRRDSTPTQKIYPDDIYLTNGASEGINMIINVIANNSKEGVLIPVPQYPLYTALLALQGLQALPYYLNEEKGWQITNQDMEQPIKDALRTGVLPKAFVVINPGNPTGQVLSEDTMRQIIRLCYSHSMVLIADEVYQDNVYKKDKFKSFRQVLLNMTAPYDKTELISFNSVSKGNLGECGFRGGYFEMLNIDSQVKDQIFKYKTIQLCPNSIGQLSMDLLVNPPSKANNASQQTIERHQKEKIALEESYKKRALMATQELNRMTNVTCNEVEGAMYAFPRIHLSQKAIKAARDELNMEPDVFYTYKALLETGIVLVPGSGFKQKQGEYHYRTTTLILPENKLQDTFKRLDQFNSRFHQQYS